MTAAHAIPLKAPVPARWVPPSRFDLIVELVAEEYAVPPGTLKFGKDRQQAFAKPRQVLVWLLWRWTAMSFPQIGARLGGRDHKTMLHAFSLFESGHKGCLKQHLAISRRLDRQCALWGWSIPDCKRGKLSCLPYAPEPVRPASTNPPSLTLAVVNDRLAATRN